MLAVIAILCPMTFSMLDPVLLRVSTKSDVRSATRRLTRTATLDGGVAISDGGYCDGDRTITLQPIDMTEEEAGRIEAMATLYPSISVSLAEGCYEVLIQSYSLVASPRIVCFVRRKLSG